jgi:hypothetical protein
MDIWSILRPIGIFYVHWVYFVVIGYILWSFGIFCGHLVYFVVIWYILWSFGIFCGHLVYFSHFGMFHQEKYGNPVPGAFTCIMQTVLHSAVTSARQCGKGLLLHICSNCLFNALQYFSPHCEHKYFFKLSQRKFFILDPILRLANLQLQRQRCSRQERFSK